MNRNDDALDLTLAAGFLTLVAIIGAALLVMSFAVGWLIGGLIVRDEFIGRALSEVLCLVLGWKLGGLAWDRALHPLLCKLFGVPR